MVFDLIAVFLLAFLLFRIAKAPDVAASIPSVLTFFLYLALFSYAFLGMETPPWLGLFTRALFGGGALWFAGELLGKEFRERRDARNYLRGLKQKQGALHELVMASHLLSHAKLGALVLIERKKPLAGWCAKGIPVDGALSRELLFSIFTPPGALHDGAVIVRKDRVAAGGVIVPLTKNARMPKELGTRHRAAVGFSEVSDAVCLVVSEETGSISLADRGSLYYDIPVEKVSGLLENALRFKLERSKSLMLTFEPQPV